MSNIIRTYFAFPNVFENGFKNADDEPQGYLRLKQLKVSGVETLTQVYFDEIISSLSIAEDKWDYAECSGGNCGLFPTLPKNTFNMFLDLGLTFATTDGIKRGKALAVTSGGDYGSAILNLGASDDTIYYIPIGNEAVVNLFGGFFIDIDYDEDFYAAFQVRYSSTESEAVNYIRDYQIQWVASTATASFTYAEKQGLSGDILEFGFMTGERLNPYITLPDPIQSNVCDYDIRVLGHAVPVIIPEEQAIVASAKCCKPIHVFASTTSSDLLFNDRTSDYYYKNLDGDSVSFILKNVDDNSQVNLNDDTFGTFYPFGSIEAQPNLSWYLLEWEKVINVLGEANYQINKSIETAGITVVQEGITFSLKEFTNEAADATVRITSIQNGALIGKGVNFEGVNYFSQLRVKGYFGLRSPSIEEESIVYKDYEDRQMRQIQLNEYTLKTELVKDCIFKELHDFMLYGNEIYIDDYNLSNHSNYVGYPVKYKSNGGEEYVDDRNIIMTLTFEDRKKNRIKTNFGSTEIAGSKFLESIIGSPPPVPDPCDDTWSINFLFKKDQTVGAKIIVTNAEAATYISMSLDAGSGSGTVNVNGIDESLPIELITGDEVIFKRGDGTNEGNVKITS